MTNLLFNPPWSTSAYAVSHAVGRARGMLESRSRQSQGMLESRSRQSQGMLEAREGVVNCSSVVVRWGQETSREMRRPASDVKKSCLRSSSKSVDTL